MKASPVGDRPESADSSLWKRYADKYRGPRLPIHLVAVELSRVARNVAVFEVERA